MSYFACSFGWGVGGWGGADNVLSSLLLAGALNFVKLSSVLHVADATPQVVCLLSISTRFEHFHVTSNALLVLRSEHFHVTSNSLLVLHCEHFITLSCNI